MKTPSQGRLSYSLVIATFKEAPNLKALLPVLLELLKKRSKEFELIIVDDNSQDGTTEVIAQLQKKWPTLRLITRTNKRGLASALKDGTLAAKHDHIIRMDADWSHHPDDLAKMITEYETWAGRKVIVGSRFIGGSVYLGKPFINRMASALGRRACLICFKVPVKDLTNDFRIFPRALWRQIAPNLTIDGNTALVQELILLHQAGAEVVEVPTTFKEREVGQSKLRVLAEVKKFFRAFPVLLKNAHFDLSPRDEITPLKVKSSSSVVLFLQLVLLASVTIFNFYLFNTAKITTGNTAARTLLALGPQLHLGVPYQDLWEYAPPGLLAAIATWTDLFGYSMLSFRFLHALLVFSTGLLLILILRKVFKSWVIESVVFFPLCLILFSQVLQTDMYSIELFGTLLSLAGLASLLYLQHPVNKLAVSAGFLVAASQIKETFTLCILILVVGYWQEFRSNSLWGFVKNVALSLYGPLTVVSIILGYLYFNDAALAYTEVLQSKFALVPQYTLKGLTLTAIHLVTFFSGTYLKGPYLVWGVLALNPLLLIGHVIWSRRPQEMFTTAMSYLSSELVIASIFSGGILGGFLTYGQISPGIRMMSIAVALFLLVGLSLIYPLTILIKVAPKNLNSTVLGLALAVIGAAIFWPSHLTLRDYKYNVAAAPEYDFGIEKMVQSRVSEQDCILHVYGWEVPRTYIYTQRRPCSRFFLSNLVIDHPKHITEYQRSIVSDPPMAIFYNEGGADLSVDHFEKTVLNFASVIEHCYTPDEKVNDYYGYFFAITTLYWPNEGLSKKDLSECFVKYGLPNGN
jgi:dolichol-phosphate mannosyltransferase